MALAQCITDLVGNTPLLTLGRLAARHGITGQLLGKPVLLAELGSRIYAVEGVENYHLTAPAEDIAGEDGVLPVLGTLSVTEMGA